MKVNVKNQRKRAKGVSRQTTHGSARGPSVEVVVFMRLGALSASVVLTLINEIMATASPRRGMRAVPR